MNTWLSFAHGGFFVAVTIVGLVLSYVAYRKKGAGSGMRGVAWSLIPLVAWLTGAAVLIGRIGEAIVRFAGSFVFSPKAWLGVVLLGVAVLLFLASGGIPLLRRNNKQRKDDRGSTGGQSGRTSSVPAARTQPPAGEDDLGDVRDILERRGIK